MKDKVISDLSTGDFHRCRIYIDSALNGSSELKVYFQHLLQFASSGSHVAGSNGTSGVHPLVYLNSLKNLSGLRQDSGQQLASVLPEAYLRFLGQSLVDVSAVHSLFSLPVDST